MRLRKMISMLLACILGMASLGAEIAPEEYRNMQLSAPESVDVEVVRGKTGRVLFSRTVSVTVSAEIVAVERSRTNLSIGDRITITYEHYKNPKKGWAGPRSIPILKKRDITPAFLRFDKEANVYVPAARGASFDALIPLI